MPPPTHICPTPFPQKGFWFSLSSRPSLAHVCAGRTLPTTAGSAPFPRRHRVAGVLDSWPFVVPFIVRAFLDTHRAPLLGRVSVWMLATPLRTDRERPFLPVCGGPAPAQSMQTAPGPAAPAYLESGRYQVLPGAGCREGDTFSQASKPTWSALLFPLLESARANQTPSSARSALYPSPGQTQPNRRPDAGPG